MSEFWLRFRWQFLVKFMYIVLLYMAKKDVRKQAEDLADRLKVVFKEDFE